MLEYQLVLRLHPMQMKDQLVFEHRAVVVMRTKREIRQQMVGLEMNRIDAQQVFEATDRLGQPIQLHEQSRRRQQDERILGTKAEQVAEDLEGIGVSIRLRCTRLVATACRQMALESSMASSAR